jgi:hypothetical protein
MDEKSPAGWLKTGTQGSAAAQSGATSVPALRLFRIGKVAHVKVLWETTAYWLSGNRQSVYYSRDEELRRQHEQGGTT